jgi:hypothetical protein
MPSGYGYADTESKRSLASINALFRHYPDTKTTVTVCFDDFTSSEPRTEYDGRMQNASAASAWTSIVKEVFWRRAVALTAALSMLVTLFSLVRNTIFSQWHPNLKFVAWIASWQWQTWVALWSVVWILVILQGAVAVVKKRTTDLEQVKGELASLKESIQADKARLRAKFSFWLQLDKEKKATPMKILSERGSASSVHVDIPCVNVVIWNEGDSAFKALGFRLMKGGATVRVDDPVGVPPNEHVFLDATKALLKVLSGETPYFSRIQGTHTITSVLEYEQDSENRESEPSPVYLKVELTRTGVFSFQVGRKPFLS